MEEYNPLSVVIMSPNLLQITFGVPQRLVLGSQLFLININNLSNAFWFDTNVFADDANLHLFNQNLNQLRVV